MIASLINQIKAARRVSVPLVAITTPDPAATVEAVCEAINGEAPKVIWDVVQGMQPRGDLAKELIGKFTPDGFDPTIGNPVEVLKLARRFPDNAVLFVHLSNRWMSDPMFVQAAWNLRDLFKQDRRTLIMLAPSIDLPPELSGDVVVFDEPLPDANALGQIITEQFDAAKLPCNVSTIDRAIEAVQGLPAFQAEQVVAMSLTKSGLDVAALWERKRRQIELTPGLKVHREAVTFADVGGVTVVKDFLKRILAGHSKPNTIVFIDEIEKFLAGAIGGGGDTSGVSQDQLGTLLSYMQDQGAAGCIFVGPPGSAKSMVAKATGNEAGIPTIQLDLGGMKGSLVGQSEQHLRAALKVITSVSSGRSLWVATCNAISELPPELRRRFTLGTYFFDLPDAAERRAIWNIWARHYFSEERTLNASAKIRPSNGPEEWPQDEGWTGAEIKQCCDISWRLGCTLKDAAQFVVPVSRSAAEQLERLRRAADGRFLSASKPGVYRRSEESEKPAPSSRGRRLSTVEA